MTRYAVLLTNAALGAIRAQALYIAEECQDPRNAKRWLERVMNAVVSLERMPRRAARAEEDAFAAYEIRQLVIGSHLLLFTVDDERGKVWVIGLRHGHRLPRPDDLPPGQDEIEDTGE